MLQWPRPAGGKIVRPNFICCAQARPLISLELLTDVRISTDKRATAPEHFLIGAESLMRVSRRRLSGSARLPVFANRDSTSN